MYRFLWLALALLCIPMPVTADESNAAAAARQLFKDVWEFRLAEDPLLATSVGDPRNANRLPSMTVASLTRRADANRAFLARLNKIDRTRLSPSDRVSAAVLAEDLEVGIREFELGAWRCPITVDWGYHMGFAQLPSDVPLVTTRDYENYIARLGDFPRYNREYIGLLREGLKSGFTLPRIVLDGYDQTIRAHIVDSPESSVFHTPFRAFPATVPEADHARLTQAGRTAIRESVVPAYQELLDFWLKEYVPGARTTTGVSEAPGGKQYYRHCVRRYTTLDVTPEEVHAIGLGEVERIRAEMVTVMRQTGFQGEFAEFLKFLRTDPRFYAKTPDQLLSHASLLSKRMDGQLPSLIGHLPRLPYGVAPVPDAIAPKFTAGRYIEPPLDGSRAGFYWVNTHKLESRPLYALEALTLHEAVPGHHLQIALQHELRDLPDFRRSASVDAFSEGWALYSERLGLEAGFYKDPYSNFGRLTYEMWRACRLVVDTGVHDLGWSRERAYEFLASNTALSEHEVRTEIDRYISWPGQALAYKMGELEIRRLRAKAETELGPKFDRRSFHDAVLANGAIPLPVLAAEIDAYIAARR